MHQISCNENNKVNNKTCNKELAKNKKHSHVRLAPCVTRATLAGQATQTYQLTLSQVATKQARSATTTTKTKITIFIFDIN
jgi:hypothetical protein